MPELTILLQKWCFEKEVPGLGESSGSIIYEVDLLLIRFFFFFACEA
jgi:hypothetical protein